MGIRGTTPSSSPLLLQGTFLCPLAEKKSECVLSAGALGSPQCGCGRGQRRFLAPPPPARRALPTPCSSSLRRLRSLSGLSRHFGWGDGCFCTNWMEIRERDASAISPCPEFHHPGCVWACLGTMSGGVGGDENLRGTVLGNRAVLWAFFGRVRENRRQGSKGVWASVLDSAEGSFCHFGMLLEEGRK